MTALPTSAPTSDDLLYGIDPATGQRLEPGFPLDGVEQVEAACAAASAAFPLFRSTSLSVRAAFLEAVAANIELIAAQLVERAHAETGLPTPRLAGEVVRTTNQLRSFAAVVREGSWLDLRVDPAIPDRLPLPRLDLRVRQIPLGPVAVFGASNFPLAFSVAGGDTASALAAGCPVVVKAHEAHPGTSCLVARAVTAAVKDAGLPAGTFSHLFTSRDGARALVRDARIKAVGFTGSRAGGLALCRIAADRSEPIPVYAEMSSTNPVFLLPDALAKRGDEIARDFVAAATLGAGQFCTNPGVVIAVEGSQLDAFTAAAAALFAGQAPATMLTQNIAAAYRNGVAALAAHAAVREVARGLPTAASGEGQPSLFVTDAKSYLADPRLREEIFGSTSLIVTCRDEEEMVALARELDGQLTATLFLDDGDQDLARALLPILETKAGRILANAYPTGVEVAHAMVHGGPFPATSDGRSSSVGSLAIHRFLRPASYQNMPQAILPAELRDDQLGNLPYRIDGKPTK